MVKHYASIEITSMDKLEFERNFLNPPKKVYGGWGNDWEDDYLSQNLN